MSTTRERYLQWKLRSQLPQIPIELWAKIFSYLTVKDFLSVRLVSRLFYACVNQFTSFWSSVIFNIDQCPHYAVPADQLRNVSSSNIDFLTKSKLYAHCQVFLQAQPLQNSVTKRRKRRLFIDELEDQNREQPFLRCSSVHFESLRTFETFQLEYLLKNRIRRLEFSYECLSTEPSLSFLFKLERLKYLKISFLHNIVELDSYTAMLIQTIQEIVCALFRLKRYRSSDSKRFIGISLNDREKDLKYFSCR